MSCARCDSSRAQKVKVTIDQLGTLEADLCPRHYLQLEDLVQLLLSSPTGSAKKTSREVNVASDKVAGPGQEKPKPVKSRQVDTSKPDAAMVREWARDNGIEVSKRGHIKQATIDAYLEAHGHAVKRKPTRNVAMQKPDPAAVRAWARSNGIEVSKRGHIKQDTIEAFMEWERAGSAAPTFSSN